MTPFRSYVIVNVISLKSNLETKKWQFKSDGIRRLLFWFRRTRFKPQILVAGALLQNTTCPHVTMFRMMCGASSSPERKDMVISRALTLSSQESDRTDNDSDWTSVFFLYWTPNGFRSESDGRWQYFRNYPMSKNSCPRTPTNSVGIRRNTIGQLEVFFGL